MKNKTLIVSNNELEKIANELRKNILKMIYTANSGHPGSSLSSADLITALYYAEMKTNPDNPQWEDRDRFLLSKGHGCPTLYSVLSMKGYFDANHLTKLRQINSILQGHPDMKKTPGIDYTTGSLGNGLSLGLGMALSAKLDKKDYRTYVMLGCGEMQEGIIWEAMMSAAKFKADNLCAIIDYNQLQLDGHNNDVMPINSLKDKISSFNWYVIECNGHNMADIRKSFNEARSIKEKPSVIIAETVKGKGVSYMENKFEWHGIVPDETLYTKAMAELGECSD